MRRSGRAPSRRGRPRRARRRRARRTAAAISRGPRRACAGRLRRAGWPRWRGSPRRVDRARERRRERRDAHADALGCVAAEVGIAAERVGHEHGRPACEQRPRAFRERARSSGASSASAASRAANMTVEGWRGSRPLSALSRAQASGLRGVADEAVDGVGRDTAQAPSASAAASGARSTRGSARSRRSGTWSGYPGACAAHRAVGHDARRVQHRAARSGTARCASTTRSMPRRSRVTAIAA